MALWFRPRLTCNFHALRGRSYVVSSLSLYLTCIIQGLSGRSSVVSWLSPSPPTSSTSTQRLRGWWRRYQVSYTDSQYIHHVVYTPEYAIGWVIQSIFPQKVKAHYIFTFLSVWKKGIVFCIVSFALGCTVYAI